MPAELQRPARGARLTLLFASTLPIMAIAVVSPALPGIAEEFAGVPRVRELTRVVLVLPALFVVIAAPWAGVVADRLGRKPLLLGALVLYAIAGSTGAWAQSMGLLLAGRAALGMAIAGIMTATTTLLADVSAGKARRHLLAEMATFVGLTSAIFLAGGGVLAGLHWRTVFLLYLVSIVMLLAAAHWVPRTTLQRGTAAQTRTQPHERLPLRSLLPLLAMVFGTQVIFYLSPLLLPFHLRDLGDPSPTHAGLVLALLAFFYAVGARIAPALGERFRSSLVYGAGFLLAGASYVGLSVQRGVFGMVPAMIAIGLALGLMIPNLFFAVAERAPLPVRGRAMGLMTTVVFLGQFLTPVLVAPITARFGSAGAFAATGAFSAVAAVVMLAASTRRAAVGRAARE